MLEKRQDMCLILQMTYMLYHSRDTALMIDMKLIQDVYEPTIAIL